MEHSLIVLEALHQGREVKMEDYTYRLDGNKNLCVVATVEGKEEKRFLGVDIPLGGLLDYVMDFPMARLLLSVLITR